MTVRAILRPAAATVLASTNVTSAANVLSAEPKQVAIAGVAAATQSVIVIDLGTIQQIDTLFIGYSRGNDDGLACLYSQVYGNVDGAFAADLAPLPSAVAGARKHRLVQLAEPVSLRYITLLKTLSSPLEIGVVAAGLAFRPQWGAELGGGVGLIDTSGVTRRRDGGFGIDPGVVAAQLQWTFSDLSAAEVAQLYALLSTIGTSRPAIVIEGDDDGPATTEEVHYGTFTRLEPYERLQPGLTRWGLRFEAWE